MVFLARDGRWRYGRDAAIDAHVATPHFQRFAEVTGDWQAKPFDVITTTVLYPASQGWAKRRP